MSDRKCDLYGAASALATFAFDMYHSLGIAGAMPHVGLPLFGLLARSSRAVINLALLGTVLNITGILLSTSGAEFRPARLTGNILAGPSGALRASQIAPGDLVAALVALAGC